MVLGKRCSSILGVAALSLGAVLWISAPWEPALAGPAAGEAESASEPFGIHLENDLLSLEAEEAPLVDVLRAIQRQRPLQFWVDSSLGGTTVSVSFRDQPFNEGLARLLKPFNAIRVFDKSGDLVGLYVLAPGQSAPSARGGEYMTLSPQGQEAGTPPETRSGERPSANKGRAQADREGPPSPPLPPTGSDSDFDTPVANIEQPAGQASGPPLDIPIDPALEPTLGRPIDPSEEPPVDQPAGLDEGPPVDQPIDPSIEPPQDYGGEPSSKPPDN